MNIKNERNTQQYNEFVDKFVERHTTDDCFTPPEIYETVAEYVKNRYCVNKKDFVRPFFPGGDYENFKYRESDIVVDNPPFSKVAGIERFYAKRNIKFFLFCPGLTPFSPNNKKNGVCIICVGANLRYDNGARVNTSFATNMETGGVLAISAPDLYSKLRNATENKNAVRRKYEYPQNVVTASMINQLSKNGVDFCVRADDAYFIRMLDAQREKRRALFGSGFLLSEKVAAEKVAAEKVAAEKWTLSERELEIVKRLGKGE